MRPKSQKKNKSLAEPLEGSEFYPIAEPSLAKPFLSPVEEKRFRWKIQNSVGSVLNPNGFGLNPKGSVFLPTESFLLRGTEKKVLQKRFLLSG